jgi:hypothetical protein
MVEDINQGFFFTTAPLLPTAPGFDPELYTPYTWRQWCWRLNPPMCAECGKRYPRPAYNDKVDKYFCQRACRTKWESRLKKVLIPEKYRHVEWEGRHRGELPEEVQAIRAIWNKKRDRVVGGSKRLDICGMPKVTYPTNSFPLKRDVRGKPCLMPPGWRTSHPGSGPCLFHGGNNSKIAKHHEQQIVKRKLEEEMYIMGQPVDITPQEAVMNMLRVSAGAVQFLNDEIARRQQADPDSDAFTQAGGKGKGREVSAIVALYNEERDRLVNIAATAAKMGIAERAIQIREEQGRMLAGALMSFIRHPKLGLTNAQLVEAPEVMREVLLQLGTAQDAQPATMPVQDIAEADVVEG